MIMANADKKLLASQLATGINKDSITIVAYKSGPDL